MTKIRRLYDKDQKVIIYNPIIEPLQIFLLDWLELGNLEIGNKYNIVSASSYVPSPLPSPLPHILPHRDIRETQGRNWSQSGRLHRVKP